MFKCMLSQRDAFVFTVRKRTLKILFGFTEMKPTVVSETAIRVAGGQS